MRIARRNPIRRCLDDTSGAAAVLVALMMIPLLGAMGIAVDTSLAYMAESRLSKSLDAAALAAGRSADTDEAAEIATNYFNANFPNASDSVELGDLSFSYDPDTRQVTMETSATVRTYFSQLMGVDSITVRARSVVERGISGMELALVLDITGSMRGSKFTSMQSAALELTKALYGDETEIENLYISVVPYVASVNVGASHSAWLNPADAAITDPSLWEDDPVGWKGCVEARDYPYDTDDTPPSDEPFTSYIYPLTTSDSNDNNYPPVLGEHANSNNARGPNLGCGAPITPLTNSRTKVDAALNAMQAWARGGTTGNLGLSWGWRTISPRWRGLWGGDTPADFPLDYDEPLMNKAVVILTDGRNQFYDHSSVDPPNSDYTAYGRIEDKLGTTSLNTGRGILDDRMAETCAAMKAEGIEIYTITFGSGVDSTAQTLFQNCATAVSMYYHAPTNSELSNIFKTIAGELARLRIAE